MYRNEVKIMKDKKPYALRKQLISFVKDLGIACLVVLVITTFFVQNLKVKGNSMYPTLLEGDMVMINKWVYQLDTPKVGDIIGFYTPKIQQPVVKRIIAKEGDVVDYREAMFFVNNRPISEDPSCEIHEQGDLEYPYKVPKDTYFVIGDNYNQSVDSRYHYMGPVEKDKILGRIRYRIWPFWLNPINK